MTPDEQVRNLVMETASLLGLEEVSAFTDRPAWMLALGEHARLELAYDALAGRIVCTSEIGTVAEKLRIEIYEILLHYNYAWSVTGGARMALDSSLERVVVILEIGIAGLTPQRLGDVLENLRDTTVAWHKILAAAHDFPHPLHDSPDSGVGSVAA